jgi:hypothetical protein
MERHLGVTYRREEGPKPVPELRAGAIAALPAGLREELRDAVTTLNGKRLSQAIQKVAEHDATLSAVLARCAEQLRYTAILDAIESGANESGATST